MGCLKNHAVLKIHFQKNWAAVSPALFVNGRKGDDGSAGPAPSAAVGASEDDTEDNSAPGCSQRRCVHRNADQQTAFSLLFQNSRTSAAAWATGNMCEQLGEDQSSTGLTTKPAKVGVQHWCLFWTFKSKGGKWLKLKVENKSQELQSLL